MINPVWGQAIEEFSRKIKTMLSTNIKGVRLFGSVAKGTATPESDIDILVIVEQDDRATNEIIIDIAVDTNLQYDTLISPIIVTESHYTNPLFRETLFYQSITKEGFSL